ncbi:hypothetical protein [Salinarimonas ramus]|uniref:Uncharacterized protein n=1 Tax=Salinarimonas ramus TaxID=690164 RepID=A0A917Q5M9_9HYPH|nr:hypothetical protein [Salinarimonas ramus]GGK26856.1 hypothetical protein GCM10011322_11640 [Salinarimonas ramus]
MARLSLVLFVLVSLVLPLAAAAPGDARVGTAVVFAPWTSQADVFARIGESGGALVSAGAFPFVAVATAQRPDAFASAVRAAGAWALLDPRTLGGCLVPRETARP